jgi:putative Mg2+ transporter-C (MgtC) family protein
MAAISQQLADITVLSIVVRILLSTFCAGTLGFERERHNQAAGFRTYIIVSDASALVMMTNIFVAGLGETDLVRMSASVITGLGFLGAGTILVTRNQEVRGLTTAAGLWAVAIIGTAFGAGFYAGGIICYAFIFLAMQVLRRVDLRIRKTQRVSTVYFEMEKKSTVGQIIRQIKGHGHYIWDLNLFSETQEKSGSAAPRSKPGHCAVSSSASRGKRTAHSRSWSCTPIPATATTSCAARSPSG